LAILAAIVHLWAADPITTFAIDDTKHLPALTTLPTNYTVKMKNVKNIVQFLGCENG
jgi:hypothetical protein